MTGAEGTADEFSKILKHWHRSRPGGAFQSSSHINWWRPDWMAGAINTEIKASRNGSHSETTYTAHSESTARQPVHPFRLVPMSAHAFEQIHCGMRDANATGYSKTLAYRADTSQTPSSRMLSPSTNLRCENPDVHNSIAALAPKPRIRVVSVSSLGDDNGARHGEVVQSNQGLWFHSAAGRR